jgi:autotransporter-associated beta strand protein
LASLTYAQDFNWVGGNATTGNWTVAGNFSPAPTFSNTANLTFNDLTRATTNEIGGGGARTVRSITFGDNITSSWTTNMTTGGVLTFAAASGNASLTVNSGSTGNITFNGGIGVTGSQSLTSNLDIIHNGSGLLTFNRQTTGTGGITKSGTGTVVFTGFNGNSFTGSLNINAGRVVLNNTQNATADLASAVNINLGGGTLEVRTDGAFGKTLSQNLTVSSASTLAYNNTTNANQQFVLSGTGSPTMALNGNLTIQNFSANTTLQNLVNIGRNITGNGKMIVEGYNNINSGSSNFGLGRVALGGNNSAWSGGLEIRRGTVEIYGNYTTANRRAGTGDIVLGATGDAFGAGLTLSADNGNGNKAYDNNIIVRSGGFRTIRGGSDHSYTFNGNVTLEGDLNVHNGLFFTDKSMILNGNISGVGGLSLTESGNPNFIRLTGNNTYSGATTIGTNATLNILSATGNAIGDNSAVSLASGAVLTFNSTSETIGSLASSGTDGLVALGANTLTTGGNNATTSFGGGIGGTGGGLTKVGTGTFTLTGNNTYTGVTKISGGTLSVAASNNLGATASNLVFDGGTLQVTGTTLANFTGIGHTVVFTANQTVGLDVNDAGHTFTVDQVLNQGTGGFTKLGAGTALLTQNNTFTGAINVNGGTLVSASTNTNISTASALNLNGGTLRLDASGVNRTVSNNLTVASNSSLVYNNTSATSAQLTFGTGSMVLNADLTARNTSAGNLTANNQFNISRSLTGSGNLYIETLNTAFDDTGDSFIPGRIQLSGNNSAFNGNVTISRGNLQLSGASGVNLLGNGILTLGTTGDSASAGLAFNTSSNQTVSNNIVVATGGFRAIRNNSAGGTFNIELNGSIALNGDLTVDHGLAAGQAFTLGGPISGAGNLTIARSTNVVGSSHLSRAVVTGDNSYTGTTTVASGATLHVSNVAGSGTGTGAVSVASGATLGGSGTVGGATTLTSGTIGSNGDTLALSSTLATTGTSILTANSTVNVTSGTTITSGTFTVDGTLGGGIAVGGAGNLLNGSGTVNGTTTVNGGTINGTLSLGTLIATGNSTIASTISASGGTTVSSGSLTVSGSLGGGAVIVQSGATLKGAGTVSGATTIQSGAFLSPGNSPELLSFGDTLVMAGTTTMEISGAGTDRGVNNANGYDAIDVTNGLTWGGTLSIVSIGGFNFDQVGTYNLFAFASQSGSFASGAISVGGTALTNYDVLANVWSANNMSDSFTYAFDLDLGTLDVTTAIPEPSSFALFGSIAVLGLFATRRRRRIAA